MPVRSDPIRALLLPPATIDHPLRALPREAREPKELAMKHTAGTFVTRLHHLVTPGPWKPGPPELSLAHCPGCDAPLRIDPAAPAEPDRLVGTCPAPQCGEVVVYRVCERRLIVADRRKPARSR
jgi:hypothetical protein